MKKMLILIIVYLIIVASLQAQSKKLYIKQAKGVHIVDVSKLGLFFKEKENER